MYLVASGRFRLDALDLDLQPGAVVGEMGLLTPGRKRTQTLTCAEAGDVLEVTYDKIRELYFQNPTFGFYFLRLTTSRLFDNIARLEEALAAREQEIARLRGNPAD